MIKNYFKIALRNLKRNHKHALLNILGLGVALAACIIVFLVIQFEQSHNKHLANYRHLYQVVCKSTNAEGEHFSGGITFPASRILRQDFPQYHFGELMQNYDVQITAKNADGSSVPDRKFYETSGVFYGDPGLMKILEVKFIRGNPDVLADVNSIAISKSTARKYFGGVQEAFGKRLNFNNTDYDYQVNAVFEDVPANSDFPFQIVGSYAGFVAHEGKQYWDMEEWGSITSNHQLYVLLPPGTNTGAFDRELNQLERKHRKNVTEVRTNFLHPLSEIHFDERFGTNGSYTTSKKSLYTLSFIGLLIILMACINFINLSTALAVTRSKEVGIRKVMGSSRGQLRLQVFMETGLIVCIALVVAIGLASLALPYVKNIMVVQSTLRLFNTGSVLFMLAAMLATVFLSGFYPAFVMGRFKPVEAIKNKISTTRVGSISLRRILVVLQFSFSQIFIIATIVAVSQMNFIRNADLGFVKESVLTVTINSDSSSMARHPAFKDELLARSDVKQVSFSFDAPSSDNSWQNNFSFDKMEDRNFNVTVKFGDENYLATYGMQMAAGKFYEAGDTARNYVVNETFVKKVGLRTPQEAIGKMLRLGSGKPKPVIGVVKDFKLQSLHEVVPPIALSPRKIYYGIVGIKLASSNLLNSREAIGAIWAKYFPEYVYDANFFEDSINNFYLQEQKLSLMYKVYAILAILISCLGLYGLVSFMIVQKTKEVGIRKVLGASVNSIMYLFSKEFTILVVIAFVLAAPAAWYLMHSWLEDFEYRISIGPGVFIAAILVSILIAWVTVGYKALKAALINPVKSLRTE